ncbi:N-acetylmuramoyl-L-alanine amidase [Muribaculum intestinale]|uniref:N-acetylmuramoyl-L-alanine amidase n=1 Tax=Muribaculum intestinale TaxID=1796646 RepID=A0A4S2FRB3_9BACT|nr:N-acetylmuramoyl-L-alanine amidase [Muribaculum intestinale]MYM13340.1 N-acetylmuramoyl-L-alanine amidase [Muribaculum intestinale]TGY71720.1 N-acetylmuramoyl-L-alanine amidase [Muribaculum intestinale]
MILILDNGHGSNTPGKCSPDKRLREYEWAREMVQLISYKATKAGIEPFILVPELTDVSLKERTRRVNKICALKGTSNCVLLSVHINAAGADGKWHNARGWTGWVAPKSSQNSKTLARLLYIEALKANLKGNRADSSSCYWVGNFAIVRDTKCPAVLTENLFMDNQEDLAFLESAAGKEIIANLHIEAIKKYIVHLNK